MFRRLKPYWIILCWLPLVSLVIIALAFPEQMGPDPAKWLVDQTGKWSLYTLFATLSLTPLRILTGHSGWIVWRRATGLAAAGYALSHFLSYTVILNQLDMTVILGDITKKPYVIVGFLALLLYVPLAITSTRGWQRRLKRQWQTLHKSIYLIAILVMLHYTWLKKVGFMETWPWCVLLLGLFGLRIYNKYYKNN